MRIYDMELRALDHKLGAYKSNKLEKWDEIQYVHFKMYKNYVGRIKTLQLFVKTGNGLPLGAFWGMQ